NGSYWINGSKGQYDNIRFIIKSRGFEYSNYTWYWGTVDLYPAPSQGNYTLRFNFNETGFPEIQELLSYVIEVRATGKYIREAFGSERTIFTINLILRTHKTDLTFDWATANATVDYDVAYFDSFVNGSKYIYGDIINVTFFWWDLDAYPTVGISPGNIKVNWTLQYYYRVFDLYESDEHKHDPTYLGLYLIQIDTRMYGKVTGNYTLHVNATLETFDRVYKLTQGIIYFELLPINTSITDLRTPELKQVPYGDDIRIWFNYTDIDHNLPIALSSYEINGTIQGAIINSSYAFFVHKLGEYSLFFYSIGLTFGEYNATIIIVKENYIPTTINFTFTIRPIRTRIDLIPFVEQINFTDAYRHTFPLRFNYIDNETIQSYPYHTYHPYQSVIVANPNDPLLSFGFTDSWFNYGGSATNVYDNVINGIFEITVNLTADVNVYQVEIFANLSPFAVAYKTIWINVTKASTYLTVTKPAGATPIYQFLEGELEVLFLNEYNESMDGYLYCLFLDKDNNVVRNITLTALGNGVFTAKIETQGLTPGATYSLKIYAKSNDPNFKDAVILKENYITVKPIWEHPIFIFTMIGIAAVAGAYTYRKVKWYLLPREVKAIEIAKKEIKKGKIVELPFRDIKDRESMFRSLHADAWAALGIKPPKLVRPEVVLFASELSAILRTRITTPEAETMINTLRTMSVEEAERYLSEKKVPPEATRRLLTIAGLIEKERMEVINFAQLLGEIKDQEISYSQAEEIMNTLQTMSPLDADKYLEAMVIPKEDRKRLLDMIGVKPFVGPKKIKEPKKEKTKAKEKAKEKPKEEERMSVEQIREELDKIPGLSDEEKESLINDMKKLSLKEQKEILKNLKG
ncbi:MAG: hypothetical protein ACTSYB_15420, partial [Candidatus Helarchaeota archaeon]